MLLHNIRIVWRDRLDKDGENYPCCNDRPLFQIERLTEQAKVCILYQANFSDTFFSVDGRQQYLLINWYLPNLRESS